MGRPAYSPSEEHLLTCEIGAKKGISEKEIAKAIGISYATFNKNKKKFKESIKRGRDASDDKFCEIAEKSLRRKVEGWEYTEVTKDVTKTPFVVTRKDKDGQIERFVEFHKREHVREVTKYYVPDTTAIIFYLVNRLRGRWESVNRAIEEAGEVPNAENFDKFMDEMTRGDKS